MIEQFAFSVLIAGGSHMYSSLTAIQQETIKMTYDDMRKIPGADSTAIQHVGTCVQTSAHQTPDERNTMIRNLVLPRQKGLRIWGVLFLIWKV